ncbi:MULTISPECIES: hypothetical protein [unclassified Streptomyces]|uniref:hypothetical protein n=1 Tax=unclassified Streptomyces TaxID=2593676 RepID=UPI002DDC17F6|nr:hypothetical protein [Streptomyces sp. NBC_01750]WSB03839.1 hypothetical protein OIE54_33985 [Streptomyces sp. NBC_01794]WSD31873.1 hypothetical protein OG966_08070 [Streptomyces sp. NBC_01750]
MQTSAVPDLAHTDARPVHWLATATAMAAVIAAAGLLQPKAATASQPGSQSQISTAAAPAPDPAGVELPLECGGAKGVVTKKASGDLDGDGNPETVAVARCDAGSGTPPSAIFVLTQGRGTGPRVVATLLEPVQKQSVGDFAVRDGAVTATLLGYSSSAVPSCCPDKQEKVKWQWRGGKFVRTAPAEARGM